jgi:hypothetical protein
MPAHKWTFKSRFRANAYGWKGTALATKRLREAISEIKKVAKSDPITAADGAVGLMERIWPALQAIDSSSGALGGAVYRTLETLIPILTEAPADKKTRSKWLERLYEAVQEDGVDYLSPVEDQWGAICGDDDLASEWADRLLPLLRESWTNETLGSWVKGGSLCLSSLVAAKRYEELQQLMTLRSYRFWPFDKFWARALVQQGEIDEAIKFAESGRKDRPGYDDGSIVEFCEQTLLTAGRSNEAYERYALEAVRATTNLATFRQVAKKYPDRDPREILLDLIEAHGPKGKWFAAAKDAGCLEVALECAEDGWADPATLIRAARDFTEKDAYFAAEVALCAIKNLLAGGGYEPTMLDMMNAHRHLMGAAAGCGRSEWAETEVDQLIERGTTSDRQEFLRVLISERERHA